MIDSKKILFVKLNFRLESTPAKIEIEMESDGNDIPAVES